MTCNTTQKTFAGVCWCEPLKSETRNVTPLQQYPFSPIGEYIYCVRPLTMDHGRSSVSEILLKCILKTVVSAQQIIRCNPMAVVHTTTPKS